MEKKKMQNGEQVTKIDKIKKDNSEDKVIVTEKIRMNKPNKHLYLGYKIRLVFCIFVFVVSFVATMFFALHSFSFKAGENINYQEKSSLDYKVYLKDNDFYEDKYLGKNMVYVASLIDKIDVIFDYNFNIDKNSDVTFDYEIVGDLVISDSSSNNVFFEKEYVLLENQKEKITKGNSFYLNKSVSIDYDYYNSLANKFKVNYGIETESSLNVYLKIKESTEDNSNFVLSNDSNMMVTIPLSERAINIKLDYKEVNDSNQVLNNSIIMVNNYLYIGLGVLFIIITIISFIKLLRLISYTSNKKSKYDKYIEKILKEYDRLIVETTTAPIIKDNNIVKINKFQELLDVRDNLKLPIKYFEITKHQKCYFYITHDNEVYLLTLKAVDFEGQKS